MSCLLDVPAEHNSPPYSIPTDAPGKCLHHHVTKSIISSTTQVTQNLPQNFHEGAELKYMFSMGMNYLPYTGKNINKLAKELFAFIRTKISKSAEESSSSGEKVKEVNVIDADAYEQSSTVADT